VSEAGAAQQKWEYRILTDRGRMGRVGEEDLNEVGDEGWELVAILRGPAGEAERVDYYFKRCKR